MASLEQIPGTASTTKCLRESPLLDGLLDGSNDKNPSAVDRKNISSSNSPAQHIPGRSNPGGGITNSMAGRHHPACSVPVGSLTMKYFRENLAARRPFCLPEHPLYIEGLRIAALGSPGEIRQTTAARADAAQLIEPDNINAATHIYENAIIHHPRPSTPNPTAR